MKSLTESQLDLLHELFEEHSGEAVDDRSNVETISAVLAVTQYPPGGFNVV